MIPCTGNCVYQREGQCELVFAASSGGEREACRYCVRRSTEPPQPKATELLH